MTILRKSKIWRLSLRTGAFLEESQSWEQIDAAVRQVIDANWKNLQASWDALYPENPIASENNGEND
ncbi:MAG: hypothetical protein O7D94_07475 [Planctomycetota bacterium]|nr:hypothetical protein [Planctomycetota bacterium]